ncbi:rod shape-determining protein MreC [Candidatus Dependentiae bacterium]|nr:rod shape-determining protein MreC [Candidatus Dependentiae bacterium]
MRESHKKKIVVFMLVVSLIWFLTSRIFFYKPGILDYTASYFVYPVISMQRAIVKPLLTFFDRKRSYKELEQQFYKVQKERDALLATNIMLRSTQLFIDNTKEIIDFKKRYKVGNAILGGVLLKNISPQEHFFLVDKGFRDGVEVDAVAVWKNCLLGRVTQVFGWYSKITLITDKQCNVAVYGVKHGAAGIHRGCNRNDTACLEHVSHLSSIDVGELLISSGQGLVFPKGFALGNVSDYRPGELFHNVKVKPLVDIQNLEYCYLIRKGG